MISWQEINLGADAWRTKLGRSQTSSTARTCIKVLGRRQRQSDGRGTCVSPLDPRKFGFLALRRAVQVSHSPFELVLDYSRWTIPFCSRPQTYSVGEYA